MARPNRYQIMELYKNDIITELNDLNDSVLSLTQVESVLSKNRNQWRLPNSTTLQQFLDYLIIKKKFLYAIEFGTSSRREKRYLYRKKEINPISLGLSLYPNSYLSHFSAVMFHDLTDEIIKSIYVNHEQSKKTKSDNKVIPQENIDLAFSKPMRSTNNYLDYNNQRIYIINGQYTGNLGIIERENIRCTDIERTLIDIAVRPQYSGGVFEVLNIFKKAKGEASVNRIAAYLKKLDYTYPYHQAIGFYLETAGYKENVLKLIENKFETKNDFYLTSNIEDKSYNKRWRIYYPKNLQ
ncbi:type IV toxin-antitoxin system AbiEi family antitoxin domain-containing protein [Gottfriedia acidiceleris]|uniref:type IV toxin-antitoxin system AbiEi family antitoxin domain-containing protein n=1 Tax=Gottfriedia acidiceleris TaxID=371036 RepID=UPI002FFFA104